MKTASFRFRLLSVILSMLVCFTAFAACSGKTEEKPSLYVITMFGGADVHAPVFSDINAKFTQKSGTDIINNSAESNQIWLDNVKRAFKADIFTPDVLFFFNGKTADSIRSHLVPLEDIIAYDPDYGKDIVVTVEDNACLPIKGFSEGIIYNEAYYSDEDFTDYETLKNKIIQYANESGNGRVSGGYNIPHYWLNHLLALE